jgi:AcrR family transcriptional regulator
MATPVPTTKQRIVDAAYELFYKDGFARASMDAIADAAAVTKRTLYYHFDSKQSLVDAVLADQHGLALSRIQRWAERASGEPTVLVEQMFAGFAAWSGKPGWRGSGFTRAAMEFAHSPGHPARRAARRHKAAVEAWLAGQFAQGGIGESKEVARQVMLLMEGCNSLVLIQGDATYAGAASEAARHLVERHRSTRPEVPSRSRSRAARR